MKDQPCPYRGAIFPNRPKVHDKKGWWWRCYTEDCVVRYYQPEHMLVELRTGETISYEELWRRFEEVDMVLTVRAILHVFVEPGKLEDVGETLAKIPEIIDVYEVTKEYDVIATAKANDLHKLRSLISEKLMNMHGVKAVTTSVVLHTCKINVKEVFK
jgi:DNA-binding Lrp family transcriptional regulator